MPATRSSSAEPALALALARSLRRCILARVLVLLVVACLPVTLATYHPGMRSALRGGGSAGRTLPVALASVAGAMLLASFATFVAVASKSGGSRRARRAVLALDYVGGVLLLSLVAANIETRELVLASLGATGAALAVLAALPVRDVTDERSARRWAARGRRVVAAVFVVLLVDVGLLVARATTPRDPPASRDGVFYAQVVASSVLALGFAVLAAYDVDRFSTRCPFVLAAGEGEVDRAACCEWGVQQVWMDANGLLFRLLQIVLLLEDD